MKAPFIILTFALTLSYFCLMPRRGMRAQIMPCRMKALQSISGTADLSELAKALNIPLSCCVCFTGAGWLRQHL